MLLSITNIATSTKSNANMMLSKASLIFALTLVACLSAIATAYLDTWICGDRGRKSRALLYDLLEGEELSQALAADRAARRSSEDIGICDEPGENDGLETTFEECCCGDDGDDDDDDDDTRRKLSKGPSSCKGSKGGSKGRGRRMMEANDSDKKLSAGFRSNENSKTPWRAPDMEGANLIAADPGIWTIPHFLTEDEVDKVVSLAEKYDDDLGLFGSCEYANPHPREGKTCGKFYANKVSDPQDRKVLQNLQDKMKKMWHEAEPRDYFGIQKTSGGTAPMKPHLDGFDDPLTITIVLYLTNGSAGTVFPGQDLTITPQKGMVLTFLNVHEDGSFNPKAIHGVQAMPSGSPERLAMNFHFTSAPKEILAYEMN